MVMNIMMKHMIRKEYVNIQMPQHNVKSTMEEALKYHKEKTLESFRNQERISEYISEAILNSLRESIPNLLTFHNAWNVDLEKDVFDLLSKESKDIIYKEIKDCYFFIQEYDSEKLNEEIETTIVSKLSWGSQTKNTYRFIFDESKNKAILHSTKKRAVESLYKRENDNEWTQNYDEDYGYYINGEEIDKEDWDIICKRSKYEKIRKKLII